MLLPRGDQLVGSASPLKRTGYVFQVVIGLLLLGTYVAFIVFGVLAARLAGDNTVMAAAGACEVYLMDAFPDLMNVTDRYRVPGTPPHDFTVQAESVEYARICYGERDTSDICRRFVQKKIPYKIIPSNACPFQTGMCYFGDDKSSYTMDTGAIPAQTLGVNTRRQYEFTRRATCAPLTINETFLVRAKRGENDNQVGYAYLYGKSSPREQFQDLTWQTYTSRNWDTEGTAPSYEVGSIIALKAGANMTDGIADARVI
ncbi:MAG: hypothetical protein Q9210_004674 [Variospora velana]